MDCKKQLELESNQPQQNRDRSRRCYSRLSDALAYAESVPEVPENVDGSPDQETSDILLPEQVASFQKSPELVACAKLSPELAGLVSVSPNIAACVNMSPELAATNGQSPKRAVSEYILPADKTDLKRNLSRTSSETAKIHLPTYYRLDIPAIGSALCSPEPLLFTMANRNQASPPPFTARPLPPIKGLQKEKESQLKQQQLDDEQLERKTEAKDAESESRDEDEKKLHDHLKIRVEAEEEVEEIQMDVLNEEHIKLNDLRERAVVGAEYFLFVEPDEEETDGISDIDVTETLTIVRERLLYLQRKGKLPQSATIVPKPPIRPKGSIVVRETKASRLRKIKLQMQNEPQDVTQEILPPLKAPVKPTKQTTMAQTPTRSSQCAPTHRLHRPLRQDCVSKFSLNDSPSRNSTLPPDLIVRETKASKLRRLKKADDEKKVQGEKTNFAFGQRVEESSTQIKQSTTPTFKPAPPKPYKKPGPVVIRETRASKMRKAQEVEEGKIAHNQKEGEKRKEDAFVQRVEDSTHGKRSPTPNFRPAPPKPYKNPGPVVIRETKASKMRKVQEVEDGNISQGQKEGRKKSEFAFGRRVEKPVQGKRSPTPTFKPEPPKPFIKPGPVVIRETRASMMCKAQENTKKTGYEETEKGIKAPQGSQQPRQQRDNMQQSREKTLSTDPAETQQFSDRQHRRREMKRSETLIAPCSLPPITKYVIEHIVEKKTETTKSKDSEMKEQKTEKEQEALDRSARDRFCRKEVVRGYKVRKQIRLAMDNKGEKWQSELESEIKIVDEAPRVQRPIATNRNMVQQELDALRERLGEVEVAEINEPKLKDKSSVSSKFKTFFKGKKTVKDEDKMKKERRKEKIDECFRKTEEKLSRQLSDDWWIFLLQQNCHHEMLKKSRLQEELIYLWKSQAIHYNVHHTMLGKDIKEGRKESWYL